MATYDLNDDMDLFFFQAGQRNYPFGEYASGASITASTSDDIVYGSSPSSQYRPYYDPVTGTVTPLYDGWGGKDYVNGNAGNDTIYGAGGEDGLQGGDGNDFVQGNIGHDTLNGGNGDDQLYGGQDSDRLSGDAGNDTLSGDLGVDVMIGGSGADIFYVGSASIGSDRAEDFNYADGDRVKVAAGVSYSLSQSGPDVIVSLGSGHQLLVANQTLSALPNGWIFT